MKEARKEGNYNLISKVIIIILIKFFYLKKYLVCEFFIKHEYEMFVLAMSFQIANAIHT